MAPVLGYWNIRGLAEPIRMMLAYKEEDFEDKRYIYGPPPDYNMNEWLKVKHSLGLAFPNLPYYIDGEIKITQSIAIMRYLARKLELDATTEEERLRTDMIEQQAIDLRLNLSTVAYKENFSMLKVDFCKNLPLLLQPFSNFLGGNKWFAGNRLTYVDFLMFEALDEVMLFDSECLKQLPTLDAFHKRFEKLPTIEKHRASPDYMKFLIYGDVAYFGSRRSQEKK